jgi:kynureninase
MPILSLAAIAAGVADVEEAGMDRIRAKSVSLTEYLIEQAERHLAPLGFRLASPRDPGRRGSHVALSHVEAWPIARAMIQIGQVIPDFRAPDSLRLCPAPLYTSHVEVHTAIQRVKTIVADRMHRDFGDTGMAVT